MSVIQGVKAAGEIIGAHKDVIVKGAQVGTSEVLKKNRKMKLRCVMRII